VNGSILAALYFAKLRAAARDALDADAAYRRVATHLQGADKAHALAAVVGSKRRLAAILAEIDKAEQQQPNIHT
jgi:hypothetical protein